MQADIFVQSQTPTGLVDFALSPSCNQVRGVVTLCATEPELNTMTVTGQDAGLISNTKLVGLSGISDIL